MALGGQVVNLIRLYFLDYPDQICSISQVAVVQDKVSVFSVWSWYRWSIRSVLKLEALRLIPWTM